MDIKDQAGALAANAVDAVKSVPLAITVLLLNGGFLWFGGWVLGEVAASNRDLSRSQTELIGKLVTEIRQCHTTGAK